MDFGAEKSFEKAAQSVKEHYGINIGGSAVRKVTLKHAKKMKAQVDKKRRVRSLPSEGKETIITEIDGTMIPTVKILEGEGDKRKRRELEWKECRLAVSQEKGEVKSYYGVKIGEVEEAGQMWSEVVKKAGWGAKSNIHVVGDGAVWIESQSKKEFGKQGSFTLDFYHASEYLGEVCKEKMQENERAGWLRKQQEMLKENEYEKVLENIKSYIKEEAEDCAGKRAYEYLKKRKNQLDYKSAISKGLPIGSGLIESGHRHILQYRLKKAGAYWEIENAKKMGELLVLRGNGEWEEYWAEDAIKLAA